MRLQWWRMTPTWTALTRQADSQSGRDFPNTCVMRAKYLSSCTHLNTGQTGGFSERKRLPQYLGHTLTMVEHDPHMNSTGMTGGFSEWKRLPIPGSCGQSICRHAPTWTLARQADSQSGRDFPNTWVMRAKYLSSLVMHPLEHWPDRRILRVEETSPIPGSCGRSICRHDPHMNSTGLTSGFSEWKRLPQYLGHAGEAFVVMTPTWTALVWQADSQSGRDFPNTWVMRAKYLSSWAHLNTGQTGGFSEWKARFLAPVLNKLVALVKNKKIKPIYKEITSHTVLALFA
jgi:hypothetical protein